MNEIELFDGTILQFPIGTAQDVIDRVVRMETDARQQGSAAPAQLSQPEPTQVAQPRVTHTTADGGRIYQMPDGSRAFTSAGYSTIDPTEIDRIMEGATPAELVRSGISEQIIRERPVASRVATAAQGIPFIGPYTDEMMAAIDPAGAENARRAIAAVREERPGQALGLEVAGALAALPAVAAATPAAIPAYIAGAIPTAQKVYRAGLVGLGAGALEGGISGFGRGEEGQRMEAAEEGASFGLLGGPIAAAIPLSSSAISSVWQNFKGKSVSEISRRFGISNDAAKVVRVALQNDDLDAAQLALQQAGSTSMLADAGPAVRRLLDVSIVSGGAAPRIAGSAVTDRLTSSGARMTQVLDDLFGPPEGTNLLQRAIRAETELPRSAAYREAYSKPIDYSGRRGRHLENLVRRVPPSAINRANDLMRIEGVQSQQILANIADDGSITFIRMPDVRQLDYITRALGDIADTQNAAGGVLGGTTQLGRATQNLSRDIRRTLRNEVPEYGVALDVAADAINRVKAVNLGASVFDDNTTREIIRDGLRGASKAERDAAKAGFRSAFDERLANINAVASDSNIDIREFQKMSNDLQSRAMFEKMETILGPADASRLYRELKEHAISLELRAAVARNSATAQRLALQTAVKDITAPNVLQTLIGQGPEAGPINAIKRLVAVMTNNTTEARLLRQMGIYDEIANVLVNTRGREAAQALNLVRRAMDGDALTERQARVIARAVTTPAAMATYSAMRTEITPQKEEPRSTPAPPSIPPQSRVQPPTVPTRGLPSMGMPAGQAGQPPAPGQPSSSREMLQQLFPFDSIVA